MLRRALLACLLVTLALPVQAHSDAELEEWKSGWQERVHETGLTPALVSELIDWNDRHPCREVLGTWVDACNAPVVVSRQTVSTPDLPNNTGMGSGVEQWRDLVSAHFGANTDAALRVMACESGGNPSARNRSSNASGLFQFLPSTWKSVTGQDWPGDVFHGPSNIAAAAELSGGGSSWRAWSCKP